MATISFTKSMKLNKKESEKLLDIIESNRKVNIKLTTPPAKEASKKTLDKVFGDK
jgi:hypothetical protein